MHFLEILEEDMFRKTDLISDLSPPQCMFINSRGHFLMICVFVNRLSSWGSCLSSETELAVPASESWTRATVLWSWLFVARRVRWSLWEGNWINRLQYNRLQIRVTWNLQMFAVLFSFLGSYWVSTFHSPVYIQDPSLISLRWLPVWVSRP